MNTIKQAKHATDEALGKYGTFRLWRSGGDEKGRFSWACTLKVNNMAYEGWGSSEEEARTEAVRNYKDKKSSYDYGLSIRPDGALNVTEVLMSNNCWYRVVERQTPENAPISLTVHKDQKIYIEKNLPQPTKHILLLFELIKHCSSKFEAPAAPLTEDQAKELAVTLYPILSYTGLWNDRISTMELNAFYQREEILTDNEQPEA